MDIFLSAVNSAWQIKFSSLKISFYIFLYILIILFCLPSPPRSSVPICFFSLLSIPSSLSQKKKRNPQKTKHEKPKTACVCTDKTKHGVWLVLVGYCRAWGLPKGLVALPTQCHSTGEHWLFLSQHVSAVGSTSPLIAGILSGEICTGLVHVLFRWEDPFFETLEIVLLMGWPICHWTGKPEISLFQNQIKEENSLKM